MEQQISILKDKDDCISDWNSAVKLEVYEKKCTSWSLIKTVEKDSAPSFEEDEEEVSYKELRSYYKDIASKLSPCQILLGSKVSGATFQVFSSLDFIILETDEKTDENLETVLIEAWDIAYKDISARSDSGADIHPVKTNIPGEYFFNFKELKKLEPYVTAKESIRPFLRKNSFERLFLLCDHKMPWFEEEMKQLNLRYTEEKIGQGLLLVIEK